jgi:hypothetical protein
LTDGIWTWLFSDGNNGAFDLADWDRAGTAVENEAVNTDDSLRTEVVESCALSSEAHNVVRRVAQSTSFHREGELPH